MSLPDLPPPPPSLDPKKEPRGFTGSTLISKEDLEAAVAENEYINEVKEFISQDQAYLMQLRADIAVALRPVHKMRRMIARMRERVYNRRKQIVYLTKRLRVKMAYEKIQKIRKEININ